MKKNTSKQQTVIGEKNNCPRLPLSDPNKKNETPQQKFSNSINKMGRTNKYFSAHKEWVKKI